ncbi:MAG TPA: YciI family protein [Bryobacteraceae bacterium]|nr:YciI family protein [Bryobacteraceae bacterium]
MQYMLLIYLDEKALTDAQREQCYKDSAQFAHLLDAAGQYVAAAPLQPTATATSVRVQHGKRLVTDGPFAETREQLGGFFIVNAKDLDQAIDIAARIPAGRWGTVEIRPVVPVPELPENSFSAPVEMAPARSTQQ